MTDFNSHADNLQDAYGAWENLYRQTHPLQERPRSVALGWTFWIMVFVSLAQILLAALRTAETFYIAAFASSENISMSLSEAVLAIIAIEIGMVSYAMVDAIRKRRAEHVKGSIFAIWVMLGISIAAGLRQSISIVSNVSPEVLVWLQYLVTISIGVGASFVAYIGGKYLGTQIVIRDNEQKEIDDEYRDYLEDYNSSMYRSWTSSKEYKVARSALNVDDFRPTFGDRKFSENLRNAGQQEQRNRIYAYVEEVYSQHGEVPGPTEISQAVGCSLSYAHECKNDWINNNGRN